MSRMIRMDVLGDFIRADRDTAGVQGEGNVTTVRLSFDPSWDGFAKTMTWWNALEEDPVERTLTADLLADLAHDIRTYEAKIPPEPLAVPGLCTLVVDGYRNGQRGRTASLRLKVEAALPRPGPSADPTPTQAEQLQAQIETILSDMSLQARLAELARYRADLAAQASGRSAGIAGYAAQNAQNAARLAVDRLEGQELDGGAFQDGFTWLDADGGAFMDGPSEPVADVDGGPFQARPPEKPEEPEAPEEPVIPDIPDDPDELEAAVSVHNQEVNAHLNMLVDCNDDGTDTMQNTSSALLDHANDPNAHQNIILDGNQS